MSRDDRCSATDDELAPPADHEGFCEPGLPGAIERDHHTLRTEVAWIRSMLPGATRELASTQELHARLALFAERLTSHFQTEEAVCAAPGRNATATARWLSDLAAEHLEFGRRLERLLAELSSATRERRCLPRKTHDGIAAFFDDLAAHELSEGRLFELALLGH
jgi:iron-sulfur cluster repair protein YtfE (RIC family)